MASLIKNGILFEDSCEAPAPSKDFTQLIVSTKELVFRKWKITLRNDARKLNPGEVREPLQDFEHDDRMQWDVKHCFGENTLNYILGLTKGNIDYLCRLPKPLLVYLVSFLDLEDIGALAQTSKRFEKICNSDDLWEHIYERHCDTVTEEMRNLALQMGWKRMFFTNKLQLQVQIRRQGSRGVEADNDPFFITEDDD